jgi:lysophospholipase L1-like esterase
VNAAPTPDVETFLRGAPWPAASAAPYPRANLADARLPGDTQMMASQPAGVRLELVGDAAAIGVTYQTTTDEPGLRGAGFGRDFSLWGAGLCVDEQPAQVGEHTVRLRLPDPVERVVVHLPEAMNPTILGIDAINGNVEPAPPQPRWIAYGDSITEGWSATSPALSWAAVTSRERGLDVTNMGYAGSARGELASADQIAGLPAEVISLMFGTNCWSMMPFTPALMRSTTEAFLKIVRAGHPGVPIIVVSPITRPDAEATINRGGASLADLRRAQEDAVRAGDDNLVTLMPGADLVDRALLADGVHPGDAGHRALADAIGAALAHALA